MFIQTEPLANPAELKFLPGRQVLGEGALELHDRDAAARSPLARHLFDIPGVSAVVLGADFITVTKKDGDWQHLKPAILGTIMEHFLSGAPVVTPPAPAAAVQDGNDGALAGSVRQALHRVIDPELGYNIVDLGLVYDVVIENENSVRVIMTTTTPGCPATNYLVEGARDSAWSVEGVEAVDVTLTYEPRWSPELMSEEAKAHFGIRDGGRW